jgi:hypothetical protein
LKLNKKEKHKREQRVGKQAGRQPCKWLWLRDAVRGRTDDLRWWDKEEKREEKEEGKEWKRVFAKERKNFFWRVRSGQLRV